MDYTTRKQDVLYIHVQQTDRQQTRGEAVQTKNSKNRIAFANRKQDGLYIHVLYSKRIGTDSKNSISCVQTTNKTGCTDNKQDRLYVHV
jgi:hypothetical protein